MAERNYNPNSPACVQWEMLLADSLDGLLKPEDEAVFNAHLVVCPACSALFEEARRGREWLEFLSPEPEVPAGLLDKILAHTGPGHEAGHRLATARGNVIPIRPVSIPPWQRPGMVARVQRFAEPRLLMTAAMAFFSIALTLNITGVRLSSLRLSDLQPGMMRSFMERQITMASTPIIRYYDNSRLAYEVQTTVRELRQTTGVGETGEGEDNQQKQQDLAPGESKHVPSNGGQRTAPPQQPDTLAAGPAVQPAFNHSQFLETSLTFHIRSAHSGGSPMDIRERSTRWIA
jgi:anti-sigma factor RsiW